ncbi:unnamed protein product, partial [Cyprideis torosa]
MDVPTIYEVPLLLEEQKFDEVVLRSLKLSTEKAPNLDKWMSFLKKHKNPVHKIKIALVGKYVSLQDSYKSISEAFVHAGATKETKVEINWIYSGDIKPDNVDKILGDVQAVLVAPGFGDRGLEGKILACQYAREHHIPFLGICLGMQMAVIEYARNVLQLEDADSMETNLQTQNPVINLMEEQKNITYKGGTMRLGNWHCALQADSQLREIYGEEIVLERHRHRYEFNNDFLEQFEANGFIAGGQNPDTGLVEAFELKDHPFYIGVQFHPEYRSTV